MLSVVRKMFSVDDRFLVRRREHVEQRVRHHANLRCEEALAAPLPSLRERLAFEEIHHEVRRAVFVRVIVDHADRARVRDRVRDVPFAKKPRSDLGDPRELVVEDLDGRAVAVAVRRRIDGRHPPDANQPIQPPLLTERTADALSRRRRGIVVRGRAHTRLPRRAPSNTAPQAHPATN